MIFKGSGTAIITPFYNEGVNFHTFRRLLDYQIENGTNAVIVLGTTGEPATMSEKEKNDVLEFAVNHINGRIPIIAGIGTNSTASSVYNAKQAASLGVDGLLVVTPYYNKCTQKGLVNHFFAIADSTDMPIILYNVPSRTGVNILPDTYAALCGHQNIVATKEACGNIEQIATTAAMVQGKMDIYSGDDAIIVPVLALGGIGIISVASNAVPNIVSNICKSFFDGNIQASRELQFKLIPLIKALFSEVNPIPVKAAMNILGFDCGVPRLPLTEMENQTVLLSALKKIIPNLNN